MPAPPLESLDLSTVDGLTLEAELAAPEAGEPTALAIVCHPHPLYGGSMHNNVVHRLISDLPDRGVATLRFNFRGVGRSGGSHGQGDTERLDVVAAVDALTDRYPGLPLMVAGYSFGADVSLAVDDRRIGGWLAVSPPLRIVDPAEMAAAPDPRPKVLVSGTADDFRPAAEAATAVTSWANAEVVPVEGVDHFWMQGLERLAPSAGIVLSRIATTGPTG